MDWNKSYYAGKTAAVTGAASGVGLALTELLLEYGAAKVTLADFNKENLDKQTSRLEEAHPGKVQGVLCNVTISEQVFNMVKRAAEFGGDRLDLLINCAGSGFSGKFLYEPDGTDSGNIFKKNVITREDWERGFALNFKGATDGCAAAVPLMIAQGGGQIVNIASGIAFSPMAYQSVYAATKAALVAYSYAIRGELSDYGVKINAATPGTTATAIFKSAGNSIPPGAQPPRTSAETILRGAAENRRLILGDASDEDGSRSCFMPDDGGKVMDGIYENFARQRRSGTLNFVAEVPEVEVTELLRKASDLTNTPLEEAGDVAARIDEYAAMRNASALDPAYYADKTAVVTGGASGVGFALCKKLLECGASKVVLADFNKENLSKREAELNDMFPGKAKGVFCNVADDGDVKAMIAAAAEWFGGRFDILINCAGIGQSGLTFPVPDATQIMETTHMPLVTAQTWNRVFSINFYGALNGCREALPIMLKQGSGQIVNVISGTALTPLPYQAVYSSAKAALNLTTLCLRYEFGDTGIRFNSATPGTTATGIFDGGDIPPGAQTPEASAIRILTGMERDDRLIPGDDSDLAGMFAAHNPVIAARLDAMMSDIAHEKKRGVTAYGIEKTDSKTIN